MKALAIILAGILLLFGLCAGGCAITFMFGSVAGDPGMVVGMVILMITTTLLIWSAVLVFGWATGKPVQSPPPPASDDTPQP